MRRKTDMGQIDREGETSRDG